jgi:hypothetical protein
MNQKVASCKMFKLADDETAIILMNDNRLTNIKATPMYSNRRQPKWFVENVETMVKSLIY